MPAVVSFILRFYYGFLLIGGVCWVLNIPARLSIPLIETEWLAPYLAVGVAAAHLKFPYGKRAGIIEILIGMVSFACWIWAALNLENWIFDLEGNTPEKFLPGIFALVAMMEAMRKSCGNSITILVWVLICYGLFGHHLPPPIQANYSEPRSLVMYLYTDTNAVLGIVLAIVSTLVLSFMVFGRLMEVSGATKFFTDFAMSIVGHRRGGPAKVAVVASSLFGSVSSSPVGNIMSTGVVTIPLMMKTGFRAHQAAAIEAVASTGGQIAPPVMGATAFLMAEFLQISYFQVIVAALLPAIFYYTCLFFQVDAIARREGFAGLDKSQLPKKGAVLARGWIFIVPLGVLMYLLFWSGMQPAFAALGSAAVLLILAMFKKRFLNRKDWAELIFSGGEGMLPIILIAGGAGVVVGIMNVTGLAQSISFILTQAGSSGGLLVMLILTAILSIILGMGMPSTAIYVVLATVIAPSLIRMGVEPIAAHLFIFYFGVMSFLTPPVAVSSYVAAGMAKASMWTTSWVGMRYAAIAFVLPFLWCYEPALLLAGSWLATFVMIAATLSAVIIFAKDNSFLLFSMIKNDFLRMGLLAGFSLAIAVLPIYFGTESVISIAIAVGGLVLAFIPERKVSV